MKHEPQSILHTSLAVGESRASGESREGREGLEGLETRGGRGVASGRRTLVLGTTAAVLGASAWAARAQTSSSADKPPVRVLIGFPPGGATDAIARMVFERLPAELGGQQVIVDNKPGAGGRIAADTLLAAPADGLTYMVAPNATPTFQMLVFGHQVKWNILRDFTSVTTLAAYPLGMGISLATGATNAREFIEWAKANPVKASFGTPGLGGQNHFLGVQLARAAGIALTVTPYKGSPPMVTDLLGGHVPAAISLLDGMMQHHRAGKIRVIGTFTAERSPLTPDIPTFAEQGVNVTSGLAWTGMWAKAGTPTAELERMQRGIGKVLALPEVVEAFTKRLSVHPHFRPGEQMTEMQRTELAHWEPIIKASGFKPES